jgi:Tfp pilus assembly protein PilF
MKNTVVLSLMVMLLVGCGGGNGGGMFSRSGGSQQTAAKPAELPETVRDEFNKGVEAYQNRQYVDAQKSFENVARIDPGLPEAHLNLALALYQQGKNDQARQHYDEAGKLFAQAFEIRSRSIGGVPPGTQAQPRG